MIEVYCDARTVDKDEVLSTCAIVMKYFYNGQTVLRKYGWHLGSTGRDDAKLKSAWISLCSIRQSFCSEPVKLYVRNVVIESLSKISDNSDVSKFKNWLDSFDNVKLINIEDADDGIKTLLEQITSDVFSTGKHSDSGSIHEL